MNIDKLKEMRETLQTYDRLNNKLQIIDKIIDLIDDELYISLSGYKVPVSDDCAQKIRNLILTDFKAKKYICLSEIEHL